MKIYLVGGAIRDELLHLPIKERDWVVVGATPEELLALGFQPVGREFPVFLHPETHEEYALARTERKVGKGYKGFTFYATPDVTLEEDLIRRDLTINAMARGADNKLIDPYGGQRDLNNKVFRHLSEAFAEDPVRILRVARFACKLPDFSVHPDTNQLMRTMVENGEINALVPERVWQEFSRALEEKRPLRFFEVLDDCHALQNLFPEIQIDGHGIKALAHATQPSNDGPTRFAALLHDISPNSVKQLCQRLRIPRSYSQLAHLTSQWFATFRDISTAEPPTILHLLKSADALRRPERFHAFLNACQSSLHAYGAVSTDAEYNLLITCLRTINKIDISLLQGQNLKGHEFAAKLHQLQLLAIEKVLK